MKPFEIKGDVYWVGALHPDLRIFDIIMRTKNGTTYNSYLIKDEKIAIIDTVKAKFADQYLQHLSELVDLSRIDYVILQHTEPDHSGSLPMLLEAAPSAKVVCAKVATKYVANTLNRDVSPLGMENGSSISLGHKTLRFISSPFLHWPDTMMTFLEEEQILFPCDIFSSHFCDSRMFNDIISRDFWPEYKYYFDVILRPYKKHLRNALKKLQPLKIEMIAPSHGPILRSDLKQYIDAYQKWSAALTENNPRKMIIYFASAHGNTEAMAYKISEGAQSLGIDTQLYDVVGLNFEGHLDLIEAADAIVFGSPTINNDVVKPIWDVLNSLVTIDIKGKLAASFGSVGWSGEAVKLLDERLAAMKFKVPVEGLSAVLVPSMEELGKCYDFGVQLGKALLEQSKNAEPK
jgi:flavorubredoxin